MDKEKGTIENAVKKLMSDARIVAALSPPAPTAETELLVKHHDKLRTTTAYYETLYHAHEQALARIEYLEVQLTHFADLRWKN